MISLVFLLMHGGIWLGFIEHTSWHKEAWRSWLIYLISAGALVGYGKATKGEIAINLARNNASQ